MLAIAGHNVLKRSKVRERLYAYAFGVTISKHLPTKLAQRNRDYLVYLPLFGDLTTERWDISHWNNETTGGHPPEFDFLITINTEIHYAPSTFGI